MWHDADDLWGLSVMNASDAKSSAMDKCRVSDVGISTWSVSDHMRHEIPDIFLLMLRIWQVDMLQIAATIISRTPSAFDTMLFLLPWSDCQVYFADHNVATQIGSSGP